MGFKPLHPLLPALLRRDGSGGVGNGDEGAGSYGKGVISISVDGLSWCLGLNIPLPTTLNIPPQSPLLRSPPGKTLALSGLSEQRDAPFSYHGNLGEKFLKFRQGNFSLPLRFRYRLACCSPGMWRPALLLCQQGGIAEIRNAGAGLGCDGGSERVPSLHPVRRGLVNNEQGRGGK